MSETQEIKIHIDTSTCSLKCTFRLHVQTKIFAVKQFLCFKNVLPVKYFNRHNL